MTSIRRSDASVPQTSTPLATQDAKGTEGTSSTSETQAPAAAAGSAATDRFEGTSSQGASLTPQAQERATAAVSRYQDKLAKILGHDAESLALGRTPARTSADLNDDQRAQLQGATKDLLMEMPISALSPAATAKAKDFLDARGVSTEGLESKTLKDLGDVGSDLGKKLVEDFKEASPAGYYGVAAAGAVAVGAYGYAKGSAALEKLGVKPEIKTELFNDQVKLRAKGSWGEKLKDPNLSVAADGTFKVNPATTLKVGVSYDGPTDALGYKVGGQYKNGGLTVSGEAAFDRDLSFNQGSLGVTAKAPGLDLRVRGDFVDGGRLSSVSAGASYDQEPWKLSASVNHNLQTDVTTGSLAVGYRPSDNVDVQLRGSLDTSGESRVGVGVTWRF